MFNHIEGLIAAPYTPMHADGSLNLDIIPAYAQMLHRNGVAGAFICGSTGEGVSLTTEERCAVTRAWVNAAPPIFKILVHVGHTCIIDSKYIAKDAQDAGADGFATMAPFYFKPANVKTLAVYCAEIANAAPQIPFYYYHIPSMTGVSLPMIELLKTAGGEIPNLAGIKFTYENMIDFQECLAFENGRYNMLFGRDEMLLCGLAIGARGGIGSTYNFASSLYLGIIDAFNKDDMTEARRLQLKSVEMIQFIINSGYPFMSASKAIMEMIGVECGSTRLPLIALTASEINNLRNGLDKINFFEYACK